MGGDGSCVSVSPLKSHVLAFPREGSRAKERGSWRFPRVETVGQAVGTLRHSDRALPGTSQGHTTVPVQRETLPNSGAKSDGKESHSGKDLTSSPRVLEPSLVVGSSRSDTMGD